MAGVLRCQAGRVEVAHTCPMRGPEARRAARRACPRAGGNRSDGEGRRVAGDARVEGGGTSRVVAARLAGGPSEWGVLARARAHDERRRGTRREAGAEPRRTSGGEWSPRPQAWATTRDLGTRRMVVATAGGPSAWRPMAMARALRESRRGGATVSERSGLGEASGRQAPGRQGSGDYSTMKVPSMPLLRWPGMVQ